MVVEDRGPPPISMGWALSASLAAAFLNRWHSTLLRSSSVPPEKETADASFTVLIEIICIASEVTNDSTDGASRSTLESSMPSTRTGGRRCSGRRTLIQLVPLVGGLMCAFAALDTSMPAASGLTG